MIRLDPAAIRARARARARINRVFTVVCWCSAMVGVAVLAVLLTSIVTQGVKYLDWDFITGLPSRKAENAGMWPPIVGSIWICAICAAIALPLGVGTAVFLEEYKPKQRWLQKLHGIVQLNIANLAGVPSIVYGIIGLTVFVQMFAQTKEPWWEIGITFHDQVADEAGNYLVFPANGRHAPDLALTSGGTVITDLGEEVTLRIVTPDELATLWDEVDSHNEAIFLEAERLAQAEVEAGTIAADEEVDRVDAIYTEQYNALRSEVLGGVVPEDFYAERVEEKHWYYVRVPFGRGVLAGGLTLMLVILPIVIVSSQEALRAVPPSLREGAFGLGSTKWQCVRQIVLPAAVPGIMTGSILAISRAIGEAAPILILAGIVYITFTPSNMMDDFTAMPLQIYNWAGYPDKAFHEVAASGIIVLLTVLLSFNALAVFIRQKFTKQLS